MINKIYIAIVFAVLALIFTFCIHPKNVLQAHLKEEKKKVFLLEEKIETLKIKAKKTEVVSKVQTFEEKWRAIEKMYKESEDEKNVSHDVNRT